MEHDIVFLCETMTNIPISVPGFVVFNGNSCVNSPNRGGTALLIRNDMSEFVYDTDRPINDQIWFRLSSIPEMLFGGCYIPPSDSLYYDDQSFSHIVRKRLEHPEWKYVLFGDFNSRFGPVIQTLVKHDPSMNYRVIDPINNPNQNGNRLLGILRDCDLLIVNNLRYGNLHFDGHLTYRMRSRWVSELDFFIVSRDIIASICQFSVNTSLSIPSDHAPISLSLNCAPLKSTTGDQLLCRASQLGDHAVLHNTVPPGEHDGQPRRRRPLRGDSIDFNDFQRKLELKDPTGLPNQDMNCAIDTFCNIMYDTARDSPINDIISEVPRDNRWQYILNSNDDKLLWKAVDWNGGINQKTLQCPNDNDFKENLECLLNPEGVPELNVSDYQTDVYIPVLDDPIDPNEVSYVIDKQLNANKSPGIDGLSPGLFKRLPLQWISTLTVILNNVFVNGYPAKWAYSHLNMLFKKGDNMNCDNYRGISVINCIAKIYDYVLYNRLSKWFTPHKEQAGAQPKRGCIEHILTLRLIINVCRKKRWKLFVTYVDFSKAYDRVPRSKLLYTMKRLGCGFIMLFAIAAMYKVTKSILGIAIVTAIIGVRQGSPTSRFLFNLFVDTLITMFKERCGSDGFLNWLHILMLMDDTVILATSRNKLLEKLGILYDYCDTHGMVVNADKTKCMVINGDDQDKTPICLRENVIRHCDQYVYLGSVFTSDGSTKSSIEQHVKEKEKHFHKLVMFLCTNREFPFCVKRKVVEAAFNAAILYSCESWIDASCQAVDKLYIGAIKYLLGIRKTTANDLCLVEIGMSPLAAVVKQRQYNLLHKLINDRTGDQQDPFMFALHIAKTFDPKLSRCIDNVLSNPDHIGSAKRVLHQRIATSSRSKFVTYRTINPNFDVHSVYFSKDCSFLPEAYRISFSRIRLSSHNLRIETSRWSRIPRDRRLCPCGSIQDEEHVLAHCQSTQHLRDARRNRVFFPEILHSNECADFKLVYDVVNIFQWPVHGLKWKRLVDC